MFRYNVIRYIVTVPNHLLIKLDLFIYLFAFVNFLNIYQFFFISKTKNELKKKATTFWTTLLSWICYANGGTCRKIFLKIEFC